MIGSECPLQMEADRHLAVVFEVDLACQGGAGPAVVFAIGALELEPVPGTDFQLVVVVSELETAIVTVAGAEAETVSATVQAMGHHSRLSSLPRSWVLLMPVGRPV